MYRGGYSTLCECQSVERARLAKYLKREGQASCDRRCYHARSCRNALTPSSSTLPSHSPEPQRCGRSSWRPRTIQAHYRYLHIGNSAKQTCGAGHASHARITSGRTITFPPSSSSFPQPKRRRGPIASRDRQVAGRSKPGEMTRVVRPFAAPRERFDSGLLDEPPEGLGSQGGLLGGQLDTPVLSHLRACWVTRMA